MADSSLDPRQTSALFDLLTHRAVYDEICQFKSPSAITTYGPPFQDDASQKSTSPILQTLLSRFVLPLPGLRDISPSFWTSHVQHLIADLAFAELSKSYDKGVLGIRKTVATALSALLEYPARGVLGGVQRNEDALLRQQHQREYDPADPADVVQAFQDFLQQLVYGRNLWDSLYERAAETDDLAQHASIVRAAHEYVIVNLASFMHYTLTLSPEGPALLRMVENVHRLAPYTLIRQTLRIGNVATMINGMVKLLLAKVSVGSITNWVGLSREADEGMNLLQQIIGQVMGWDKKEFRKRVEKLEKDHDAPAKEVRMALDDWIGKSSREEHEETRRQSREQGRSIVAVILSLSSASVELTDAQHAKALEYLSLQLSIRDRTEIVRVLCKSNPDHLTQGIRDGVAAYEPMIRQVHQAVDLSATVGDFEAFMDDMIRMSRPKKDGSAPSVEDYVKLLHDHMAASHRFIHQVAKNGKEVTKWFQDYCLEASTNFKQKADRKSGVQELLAEAYKKLSQEDQSAVRKELDAYAKYLDDLHTSSAARTRDVIANKSSTAYGPGAYLARWQELLDSTPITPDKAVGPVRKGKNNGIKEEARKDVDGSKPKVGINAAKETKVVGDKTPDVPGVDRTVELLGKQFTEILNGTAS